MTTITHRMELEALEDRVVYLIDPHGDSLGYGILTRDSNKTDDDGETYWRVVWDSCLKPTNRRLYLDQIADIAGTVIELKSCFEPCE